MFDFPNLSIGCSAHRFSQHETQSQTSTFTVQGANLALFFGLKKHYACFFIHYHLSTNCYSCIFQQSMINNYVAKHTSDEHFICILITKKTIIYCNTKDKRHNIWEKIIYTVPLSTIIEPVCKTTYHETNYMSEVRTRI